MNYSKELKPVLVYKDPKEIEPYSSIVVPSSMRSPLWKYFGFPADENRVIKIKNRIICSICHVSIAYNKNTTNLSTHLNCKHPEILNTLNANKRKPNEHNAEMLETSVEHKIERFNETLSPSKRSKMTEEVIIDWCSDDDVQIPAKVDIQVHPTGIIEKTFVKDRILKYNRKPVVESIIVETMTEPVVIESHDDESDNQYIETIDYDDIHIHENDSEFIAEALDTDSTVNMSNHSKTFLSEDFLTMNESNEVLDSSTKEIVITTKFPPKIANKINVKRNNEKEEDSYEVRQQIKKFLIKDLIPTTIVDGSGFKELMGFLSTHVPNSLQIEQCIEKDYNLQHSSVLTGIKSIVSNRNYSLSFHKLGNSSMVEISVNYWSDVGNRYGAMENQFFCTVKNCTNFVHRFTDSLDKCSAFVVDFDLKREFQRNLPTNIPIIPTFSYVTRIAFEECMRLSAIQTVVNHVDTNLKGKIAKSHTWLQQFEHLSQFLNDSTNDDNNQIIQVLIECFQPLKNCLDVLAFESSAYASIMKPIAIQLLNQHYECDTESLDSEIAILERDLRRIICQILQQEIIENPFLTMASFLDPRFQRLTLPDDLNTIHDELEKFVQNDTKSADNKIEVKQSKIKNDKNFGLSSLFSNLTPITKEKPAKSRFDIEFRSYIEDVSLDMELCPLEWWFETDSLYPIIRQHVKKYFCVPAFVNNFHRLPLIEIEELESKYDRIGNDTSEKLLWLHLNELRNRLTES